MNRHIRGLHHVTAIATDPQRNVDFYNGLLGLRLVKKTVNYDDPGTYHLYYGDGLGRPGTILTFFPWPGARRGTRGAGQATTTAFTVREGSLEFWRDRLAKHAVVVSEETLWFGDRVLKFLDPDGLELALVEAATPTPEEPWLNSPVPVEMSIGGFHSVTLREQVLDRTQGFLEGVMGFKHSASEGERHRFESHDEGQGRVVDLVVRRDSGFGRIAAGTVHHIAWRVPDDAEELEWRRHLLEQGADVSPVMDRQYFKSIYFREPGGVLFEIATDPPGFTLDEAEVDLGSSLMLPPWLESERKRIEAALPAIHPATPMAVSE